VQVYGGAWQGGSRTDHETFARYFAHRGYVVFAIEYRHAPVRQWPAQIEDVRSALAWIRAQGPAYEADPGRLVIVGRSAGAQLALVAAYTAEPAPAAVVNFYGPTDLAGGWSDPPDPDPISVRDVLETFLGGAPDAMPERYREASPITYAAAGPPAALHIYGARDHVVLPRFGRELHEKLRSIGATSVLLEIPWAEHAFDELPNGLSGQLALYYTERFLDAALRER
jgi:acetyl esterase/lipase